MRQQDPRVPRTVSTPWRRCPGKAETRDETGFTLVELIIVTLIIPVIIGAITLALISVFSLQAGTSGRVSDSGDAQIVSTNFETDVQDASYVTTNNASVSPAPCETTAQINNLDTVVLGLQVSVPNQPASEVTYLEVPSGTVSPITYSLVRNSCPSGVTTPVTITTVSHNVPSVSGLTVGVTCDAALVTALPGSTPITSLVVAPLTYKVTSGDKIAVGTGASQVIFTATSTVQPPATPTTAQAPIPVTSQTLSASGMPAGTSTVDQNWPTNCGAGSGWISTASVTGVAFSTTGAGTSPYRYNLTAVPRPDSTSVQPTTIATNNSNCVFATGSGTYTSSLCFVDLSAWNTYNGTTSSSQCPGAGLAMTANINRTAEILTFCLKVQSVVTSSGAAVSGPIAGEGINGVAAVPFPTYPGAFLGNNGFYTVTNTQEPALYQLNTLIPKTTTVTITNIKVSDPSGNLATGWELVTGDAETTDTSESITWSSDQVLTLLPNTPTSPVGNACQSVAPAINTQYLTGLGTKTVQCSATDSSNKAGTVMLEAPNPAGLTVTMVGTGLEGMFLGVMLPYTSS